MDSREGTPSQMLGSGALGEGSPLKDHRVTERVPVAKKERKGVPHLERVSLS